MNAKAKGSYQAAVCLLQAKHYNSAASRAYYSLYQAIVYYLEKEGYQPSDLDSVIKKED